MKYRPLKLAIDVVGASCPHTQQLEATATRAPHYAAYFAAE